MAIKTVGVVGGGLMGSGIAQTVAAAGYDVLLAEVNQDLLDKGLDRVHGAWEMLVAKGKITEAQAAEYRGHIRGTLELEEFADCDLVIEAIIENLDAKRTLFRTLDGVVKEGAILASNTSSLPIIEMAAVTSRQERVAGIHFFNPAPVMKLVEIVRTITTSDETVTELRAFRRITRQDPHRRQRYRWLCRQFPVDSLHAFGDTHVRARIGDHGRHRYRHEAWVWLPDGAI